MLKGINSLLNADVLYTLRAMGHGDDLIIADTNFPSELNVYRRRFEKRVGLIYQTHPVCRRCNTACSFF